MVSYRRAMRSIAFYPILVSLSLFLLSLVTLNFENLEFVTHLKQKAAYIFISDSETARTILSTLIGSILSLTVFSFTMVMVVLSQASTNFSPRLLPSLISNKRHQLILGFYLGTLLYCMVILIALGAYELKESTIGMSTTIAALLGILCVGLFVSFIHNISQAVQVQNIVRRLFDRANQTLDKEEKNQETTQISLQEIASDNFSSVRSEKGGYFQGFDIDLLHTKVFKAEVRIVIVPYQAAHIWKGGLLLKTSRNLSEAETTALRLACSITTDLHDGNAPLLELIKLMEIAVRAMSPGINDPGTAVSVVHKLGPLLVKMVRLPAYTSLSESKKPFVIIKTNISTKQLLEKIVQPIRLYAKKDSTIMTALIDTLCHLRDNHGITEPDMEAILEAMECLRQDISDSVPNKNDKELLLRQFSL